MSLIWADNFSSYGTNESRLTDGLYAAESGVSLDPDPDPNASGTALRFDNAADQIRFALPGGSTNAGGVGFRIWYDDLPPSTPAGVLTFLDASAVSQINMSVDSSGVIHVYRGASGTTSLGNSGTPVLTAGAWNHVEIKTLISDTVGTVEVRVNGVVKIALTNQDTKINSSTGYSQVRLGAPDLSGYYIKDLVIWDTSGSVNNDFLGSVAVVTSRPNGDVSFNWTPSTGTTGFNLIDESTPNDADYISAADPPPAASTFSLEDVSADVTSIKGIVCVGRMRKTDGGDCNIQMSLVSGASSDLGTDRPVTSAFTYYWDISELDPNTGTAWTPPTFNAASVRVNRTL